jgi:hypothetical protein
MQKNHDQNRYKQQQNLSNIKQITTTLSPKTKGMSTTKGTPKIAETPGRERMSTTAGSKQQLNPSNSRNANNSIVVIQQGSQPQQGDKQLQGLHVSLTPAENLSPESLILVANYLFIRIFDK